jgi:histidinol-phosphate aminotransferase
MKPLRELIRKNILNLTPYSSARSEFKGRARVFLDANENPFGELNRYPDPLQLKLKKVLASQLQVSLEQLFIGNGSDEVIDLLFRIFCNPGKDNVITFSPSYGMYEVSATINDTEVYDISLTSSFDIDEEELFATVNDNTKIIFICSPNNPTGNCVSLSVIAQICQRFNGIVLVDEAYIDFADTPSSIELLDQFDNLIISQTFSKARGLAAARVGYAIANPVIIDYLNAVKPPYNVSLLNQEAALKALTDVGQYRQEVDYLKGARTILKEELNDLSIVTKVFPSEANFLLVQFTNGNAVYDALVEVGIITRNRTQYVPNCLRITVGTKNENDLLINTLKSIEA